MIDTTKLKIGDSVMGEDGCDYIVTDMPGNSAMFPDHYRVIDRDDGVSGLCAPSEITHVNGAPVDADPGTIDIERLKTDLEYWDRHCPKGKTTAFFVNGNLHQWLAFGDAIDCPEGATLNLIRRPEPITLKPGDHVLTKDLSEDDYHAVARALMNAGAGKGEEYPATSVFSSCLCFGWNTDESAISAGCLFHQFSSGWSGLTRTLTVNQVLTATNAGGPAQKAGRKVMEEYTDALKAMADDGWIPWHGVVGVVDPPVTPDVIVDVKYKCGEEERETLASEFYWDSECGEYTIIAYRLHQTESKQWRGPKDGLPPVGSEVQVDPLGTDDWYVVSIVAHNGDVAVFCAGDEYPLGAYDAASADAFDVIQSDRERVIEAAMAFSCDHPLDGMPLSHKEFAVILYDKGLLHLPPQT